MVLSEGLRIAARRGDIATIQAWLEAGGNPDERTGPLTADAIMGSHEIGQTLLHHAVGSADYTEFGWLAADRAEVDRCRTHIVRILLAHGATVDAVPENPSNTPLFLAALRGQTESVEQLCLAGANVNHKREQGDFPLWHAADHPSTVRVLLRFGADPSMTFHGTRPEQHADQFMLYGEAYRESSRLLRDARLLRPRLRAVFALRALCHRGRAAPTSETPSAFARLIGGGTSRPRTRAAAKTPAAPGLPDPLAHLVCKFWLGSPPRRRRVNN